jgi:membrane peptidoglycan carboxypeptidase
VAAKTGTTNESRDAWTIGYTPTIAIGAWAGNNDNTPMVKEIAGYIVAPMWHDIMQYALTKYPQEFFTPPQPIPDSLPGALRGLSSDGTSYHDILYWVNKDDPRGGGTSRGDGQFPYWEYPIGGYVPGMNYSSTSNASSTSTSTDQNVDNAGNQNSNNSNTLTIPGLL